MRYRKLNSLSEMEKMSITKITFIIFTILFCISECYSSNCNTLDKQIHDYVAKLEPFYEKIKSHQTLSANEAKVAIEIVKNYYNYLVDHNIVYAKLARDVVNNHGLFGITANVHLEYTAKAEGHANDIKKLRINIPVSLAYKDAKLRSECKVVSYRAIADYHYETFQQQGLSKYAWGGTLLEEFAGSGSYMRLGGYDKTIPFSPIKLTQAIATNKEANGVKARVALNSLKHLLLVDSGKILRTTVCENWPVLCNPETL